jgi:excisionase family DNA binding protein
LVRVSLERQLEVPPRHAQAGYGKSTVEGDHDIDILDMKEAAELLHFTPSFLSKIINGKVVGTPPIPHIRVGRSRRFRRESVLQWLEDQEIR